MPVSHHRSVLAVTKVVKQYGINDGTQILHCAACQAEIRATGVLTSETTNLVGR